MNSKIARNYDLMIKDMRKVKHPNATKIIATILEAKRYHQKAIEKKAISDKFTAIAKEAIKVAPYTKEAIKAAIKSKEAIKVAIEAIQKAEVMSNKILTAYEEIGIYFNGVADGKDCKQGKGK